ncbi:GEVED domain-containing protein [Flavobacterium sp.]|uniref:GEVED domain-containing protein n=1 Tax=Flavobacterium sp. TaxID=239 RepID=UPI0037504A61
MIKTTLSYKKRYLSLIILLISFLGYSQSPSTFTSSGTWVCPKDVTSIQVEAWGAGGGGGGSSNTSGYRGAGGGGGAYKKTTSITVTPGTSYTITVGTGGIAGTISANGGAGGNSTIVNSSTSATIFTVNGGSGGETQTTATAPTAGAAGTGGTYNGGNGYAGASGTGGGGGGGAGTSSNGNTATSATGATAGTGGTGTGGTGGGCGSGGGGEGCPGTTYGGGGGGGNKSKIGGAGAGGYMVITFTCPSETANAGSDQTICLSTATLAGNTPVSAGLIGTWTVQSGTATITSPNSPTSGLTGLLSGTSTLRWTINNGLCGSTYDDVIITTTILPIATTPSPSNAATGVCYGGTVPVTSVSWASVSGATSYDVYFGAGSLPGTVTANVATNSYSTGTLLASTTYYWKVVAKNACGSAVGSSTWTFTTTASPCIVYCTPTASSGVDGTGITNVSYSSVNNPSSNTIVYNDYTAQIGNVYQGTAMPISITTSTGQKNYNIKIWADWNNDGDFVDSGEEMFSSTVYSTTINGTINVPSSASVGNHRMRVGITQGQGQGVNNETATPCFTGTKGAFEDYILNVTSSVCTTAIPAISTNPASVSVSNGATTSFTSVFSNTPNSYLWEVSSDGGTNYIPITNGGVYSGATTATLTITGVSGNMNNFKYRVSASNACGTSSVSTVAVLTVTISYCKPTTPASTYWIANVASQGNLNDTSYIGVPAYSTGVPANSTLGYADYSATTIATQTPGGGMNFSILLSSSVLPGTNKADRQRFSCFVDWNGDGDFVDVGETVYTTGVYGVLETTFGFVVPLSQSLGNYRMRIRSRNTSTPTIDPCTVSSTYYPTGEVEDYTISVVQDCAAKIQSVTNGSACGTNTVTLGAVGLGGTTQYRWYSSATGGTLLAITSTGSWTTPSLTTTTVYYVTSFNGSCESLVRTRVVATIVPTTSINFTPTNPTTCGEDNVITINAAGDTTVLDLFVEDFEGATTGLTATMTATNPGGDSSWGVKTNTYTPSTIIWKPAINSGIVGSNFALTTSDYASAIITSQYSTTTSVNTTDFINLTLTFNNYFSYYSGGGVNSGKVQVSTNGGTSWTTVKTYSSDLGVASKFTDESIDLSAYINQPNLKLRFEYYGDWADGWAIDDIRFFGTKQLNTTFSWSSATPVAAYTNLACTVPYVAQKVTTIYLKPDLSQLETVTFPITVNATLGNGCPVSQIITVTNNTKVWRGDVPGTSDTTSEWNDPNNWRPYGVPTASNCVVAPENTVISGTNYLAYAKNVVVKSTGSFEIQAGNNLTVTDFIKVETGGVFNLKNNASIVQLTDVANTGNVNIQRITQPMNYYDYTYWNSPVAAGSNFTFASLSPGTSSDIWSYSATIGGGSGNWLNLAPSTVLIPTKGYIVKAPDTFSSNPSTKVAFTATFVGTPNNGPILAPVSKGSNANLGVGSVADEDDEWNLIGNPYPSGLDAKKFLDLPANANVVDGTIYIWTHNTQPSAAAPDPFYGDYVLNYTSEDYAAFNKTGATGTASSATTGGNAPTGFIASGQAFFVRAASGMSNGATANATFNNSMRVTNNAIPTTGTNSDFFKSRKNPKATTAEEKHRIWLNLTNNSGAFSQTLIGYITDATQGLDRSYDGESFGGNDVTFYSIIPEANLTIQGRALPFDPNDSVPLGFNAAKKGNYSIRIDHLDGVFDYQNIYLEDKDLNIIYDLKQKPYVFNTTVGTFDNRFVLRYSHNNNKTLSVDENSINNNDIKISYIKNNSILMINNNSLDVSVQKVTLFNVLGQSISTWKIENQDQKNIQLPIKNLSSGIYIAKVKTFNGDLSKKIIIP